MKRRNTIQKELVLGAVQELKIHPTADELYNYISADHPNIGKGTVYRNLGILADEGSIRRVEIPNGPDRFDFTLKNHYHVVCVNCNKVEDVDMDIVPDIMDNIRDRHHMEFIDYDILFRGLCPECQNKE